MSSAASKSITREAHAAQARLVDELQDGELSYDRYEAGRQAINRLVDQFHGEHLDKAAALAAIDEILTDALEA